MSRAATRHRLSRSSSRLSHRDAAGDAIQSLAISQHPSSAMPPPASTPSVPAPGCRRLGHPARSRCWRCSWTDGRRFPPPCPAPPPFTPSLTPFVPMPRRSQALSDRIISRSPIFCPHILRRCPRNHSSLPCPLLTAGRVRGLRCAKAITDNM